MLLAFLGSSSAEHDPRIASALHMFGGLFLCSRHSMKVTYVQRQLLGGMQQLYRSETVLLRLLLATGAEFGDRKSSVHLF